MANETKAVRVNLGPVTLAACLLELVERLYARLIVIQRAQGDEDGADETVTEFEEFRNEWRPHLERMIRTGRSRA